MRYCIHLLKVSNRFRLGRYLSNIWRADNVAIVAHECVVLLCDRRHGRDLDISFPFTVSDRLILFAEAEDQIAEVSR